MGILQGVIVWLAFEDYAERNVESQNDGWQRRARSSSTPANKYHCKAVNGLFATCFLQEVNSFQFIFNSGRHCLHHGLTLRILEHEDWRSSDHASYGADIVFTSFFL